MPPTKPKSLRYLISSECSLEPINYSDIHYFYYSPVHRVTRLVTHLADGATKKKIYFQSSEGAADWTWTKGSLVWDLYNKNQVVNAITELASRDYKCNGILFAEGEKVADAFSALGYITVSAPGHSWNESWLRKQAKFLSSLGIEYVTYIPDNDDVGKKKAELVVDSFWFEELYCDIVSLDSVFSDIPQGGDFADLCLPDKTKFLRTFNDREY